MKSKKADAAKLAGLFCVPLIPLVAAPTLQRYQKKVVTQQMVGALSRSYNPNEPIAVEDYVRSGADVNARDENGNSVLSMVAGCAYLEVEVPFLLAHGADPNSRDKNGEPVLMQLVRNGDAANVRSALEHGADAKLALDGYGLHQTALAFASNTVKSVRERRIVDEYREIIQLLKAAGAKE